MTKLDLATNETALMRHEQLVEETVNGLIETLSKSVSMLANLAPETTVDVLNQLYNQIDDIKKAGEVNLENLGKRAQILADNMPDTIVFDEEE